MPQEATVHVDQLNKIIRSKIIQQQELLFWARVPNTHLETSEQSYTCKQVKRKKDCVMTYWTRFMTPTGGASVLVFLPSIGAVDSSTSIRTADHLFAPTRFTSTGVQH